jgi:hypothetical protein
MQKLSFLQSEYAQLVSLLPSLVKGLQKATCIYESDGKWFQQSMIKEELQELQPIDDNLFLERILSFSTTKKQFIWLAEDDLPFEHRSSSVLQLQLTQETERSVLVFYLEKANTYQKDLLFLYFNPDANYFGLRKKSNLSTQEKTILGHVLWNALIAFKEQNRTDFELFREIVDFKKRSESDIQGVRSQLEKERNARGESLVEYANIVLESWANKLGINITLTTRAYDKIKQQAKSFKQLEMALEKSIRIAINLVLSEAESILLDDFEISLEERILTTDKKEVKPLLGRLESTQNLLDKYENSAQLAKEAGERVLGKTVGQFCQPPISNAAITDAVKNHRDRIIRLLESYPDRWPIIRTEFKTITNLQLPLKSIEKKAG